LLPFDAYRGTLRFTQDVAHPLKAIRDCGVRLRTSGADVGDGFYNAASDRVYHSYFYYLRHLGPWVEARHPQPDELNRRLHAPGEQTPVLMSQRDYNDRAMAVSRASLSAATSSARAPSAGITINDGIVVLLPGPYEACVPPAVEAGAKQATGRGGAS